MNFTNLIENIKEFISRRVVSVTPLLLLSSLMITSYLSNPSVAVVINGEVIGIVDTQNDFETQVFDVEKTVSEILDTPYSLDIEKEYKLVYGHNYDDITDEHANEFLSSFVTEVSKISIITIDGKTIAATETLAEANDLLENLLVAEVGVESLENASFVQDVEITEELGDVSLLKSSEEILEILTSTETGPAIHKVAPNETLSGIAQSYGMKTSEVEVLNPDVQATRMSIGQDIVIEKAKPALSVEVVKEETYTKDVAFSTTTEKVDTMTTTQRKTIQNGVNGKNEIVASVTYIDGVEVSRTVLSETVISQPVDEIVQVGTKQPVSTGVLRSPASGTLTSPYGYRWGKMHTGIDIANSSGTAIYAADGGTVVFSGWNGGYGNCVIISHGNGMETLYAHNSANLVSKGDKVSKGDQIAKMGSTGNSTGSHLHFEVKINGNHQNPQNYLN